MATFAFQSGVTASPAFGQRNKVRFVGTWANGDTWTLEGVASLAGDFTLGKGNIAGNTFLNGIAFKDRIYLSFSNKFAFSANAEPTLWEEQNSGAGVVKYNSQYGATDIVRAFSAMQGRLAVFGEQSVQLWQVDADPANFALLQTLDNTGTKEELSVQSIGDADVYYLDSSGIRSLRAKELNLNAEVSDVGTPIDSLVKPKAASAQTTICSIVEPSQRQYWCFVDDTIFVLSRYSASKIVAWSTFLPTVINATIYPLAYRYYDGGIFGSPIVVYGSLRPLTIGQTYLWTKGANEVSLVCGSTTLVASGSFVATDITAIQTGTALGATVTSTLTKTSSALTVAPQKFVVYNQIVYFLATNGALYKYGTSSDSSSYDATQPVVELPYYDLKDPSLMKQAMGIRVALSGQWTIQASMDPQSSSLTTIGNFGNTGTPDMNDDSTFDVGTIAYSANGSHFKLKFTGDPTQVINKKMKLGKITFEYMSTNRQ